MHLPRVLRPPRALRRPARLGALAAGAVLAVLIFPAPDLSVLAWFTLVPGLMVIRNAPTAREAGVRGWWLASGYIMAAMYWLAPRIGPGLLPGGLGLGGLPGPLPGPAAGGAGPGRAAGPVRGLGLAAPAPAAHRAAVPGRAGGGAELLAAGRV